jgi:hypothetical protein
MWLLNTSPCLKKEKKNNKTGFAEVQIHAKGNPEKGN